MQYEQFLLGVGMVFNLRDEPHRVSSQGQTGQIAIFAAELNRKRQLSQGQVPICPTHGSRLSQARFPFVPNTVPPKMLMFIGFSCPTLVSKQGSTPTPWARGLRDQIQKWALQTQKTLYISRVFCAQRGIETMVSDHGLGRGQTMG